MRGPLLVGVAVATLLIGTVSAEASSHRVWTHTYDGGTVTAGVSIAVDPGNGNVYELTEVGCCPLSRGHLIAYSSSGTKLWAVDSGDPTHDTPTAVMVDAATHDVLFTGTRNEELLTEAYSATGTLLWTKVRAVTGYQLEAVGIVSDGHGRAIVAASTRPTGGTSTFLTIAYQISTGDRLWLEHYGEANSDDDPVGIAVDPAQSRVYVTGSSLGTNFQEMVTVAYDSATGNEAWTARNIGGDDLPVGVAVDTSNHQVYALTGTLGDGYESTLFAYTSTGATAWHQTYQQHAGQSFTPVALAVDPGNGQVYVAGAQRTASGKIPTLLLGYSSSGTQLWVGQRDDGDEVNGFPRVLAADRTTHRVYLGSDHSTGPDEFVSKTWAFSAAGAAVWSESVASPNPVGVAGPAGIAVDPGRAQLYVTGAETGFNTGHAQAFCVTYQV